VDHEGRATIVGGWPYAVGQVYKGARRGGGSGSRDSKQIGVQGESRGPGSQDPKTEDRDRGEKELGR